jgi:hypothetical protein
MAVNPIYDTYSAIWDMLETKSDFTALFPNGSPHQVRYITTASYMPDPDPEELNPADYPRCRVVLVKAAPNTQISSSGSVLQLVFTIEICTGQEDQTVVFAACWAIYRAMLKWQAKVRDTVTWSGAGCVHDVDSKGVDFVNDNKERNRGTKQWIAVWQTTVSLDFSSANLEAL